MATQLLLEGKEFFKQVYKYPPGYIVIVFADNEGNYLTGSTELAAEVMQERDFPALRTEGKRCLLAGGNYDDIFNEQAKRCLQENRQVNFKADRKHPLNGNTTDYISLVPIETASGDNKGFICFIQNNTGKENYFRQFARSKIILQKLHEQFPAPFYITDENDTVIEFNNAAKKNMHAAKSRDESSQHLANFVHDIELVNTDLTPLSDEFETTDPKGLLKISKEDTITGVRFKGDNFIEWYRTFAVPLHLNGYGFVGYNEHITVQKQQEEHIAALRNILNAIINCSTDNIAFVNTHNVITLLNKPALRHYSRINQKLVTPGDVVVEVIPQREHEVFENVLVNAVVNKPLVKEFQLMYPNGENVWLQSKLYPVHDEKEEYMGYVMYSQDITPQKEHELTLEKQNKQLKEIARLQAEEFIRPLATVLGLIRILIAKSALDKETLSYLGESATQLEAVIRAQIQMADLLRD